MTDKPLKTLEMSDTMRALRICQADLCNPNCPLYEDEDCTRQLAVNALRVIDYWSAFQRPKPVEHFRDILRDTDSFACPNCFTILKKVTKNQEFLFPSDEHCPACGQALDWEPKEGDGDE